MSHQSAVVGEAEGLPLLLWKSHLIKLHCRACEVLLHLIRVLLRLLQLLLQLAPRLRLHHSSFKSAGTSAPYGRAPHV